jgi:hypothetical protein
LGKGILKKVSLADYLILNLRESIHPEKADLDLPKTLGNLWQTPIKKRAPEIPRDPCHDWHALKVSNLGPSVDDLSAASQAVTPFIVQGLLDGDIRGGSQLFPTEISTIWCRTVCRMPEPGISSTRNLTFHSSPIQRRALENISFISTLLLYFFYIDLQQISHKMRRKQGQSTPPRSLGNDNHSRFPFLLIGG